MEYELNQIMDEMEENLPAVPLPPPAEPQLLPRDVKDVKDVKAQAVEFNKVHVQVAVVRF